MESTISLNYSLPPLPLPTLTCGDPRWRVRHQLSEILCMRVGLARPVHPLPMSSPHQFDSRGFPVAQMVNNSPAMQEIQVWFVGQEDPLKEGMSSHSSILAWRIPWIEEPGWPRFMGSQRLGHDWRLTLSLSAWLPSLLMAPHPWLEGGVDGLGKEGIASSHRALFSVHLRTSWRISFS